MKKKIWAGALSLLILSGCVQQQISTTTSDIPSGSNSESVSSSLQTESEESMTENSASVAEIGVNGMTEEEILELFTDRVNAANDINAWLTYDCYEDFDENSEGIYDTDHISPEGFHWRPLIRFETRQALYDYVGTVFRPMGVPTMLDGMFGEGLPGVDENGNPIYSVIFKEIDGCLYGRDRGRWREERPKMFDYALETAVVAEETEGKIAVDVRKDPKIIVGGYRLHLWFDNSNWVISRHPTILYREWK